MFIFSIQARRLVIFQNCFSKYSKLLLFQALEILELYRRIYEGYLAIPVIKGMKSEVDTFGGAIYTNTVEVYVNCRVDTDMVFEWYKFRRL
jgi:prolyl-tRNA synthetase